jgi:hypothetical protein
MDAVSHAKRLPLAVFVGWINAAAGRQRLPL